MQEVGHRFCDTILDFCDPDQAKVRHVLEELEIMLPKNSDSESSEASDGDSASDDEAKRDARGKLTKGGAANKKKTLG